MTNNLCKFYNTPCLKKLCTTPSPNIDRYSECLDYMTILELSPNQVDYLLSILGSVINCEFTDEEYQKMALEISKLIKQ